MTSSLEHTLTITAIFLLNIKLCICFCARAEYEINGECCPMCSPGSRVYRHCTELISTTCIQCVGSTYTSEPNGLPSCISCTVCDAVQGLRVKTACTRTSDTVCEPMEGFYCTDEHWGSCRYAAEHTKCSPGQYIKQKGTALKNAECADCTEGTYSNGSLQMCKQHTKCEDLGLVKLTPGTNYSDVQCGESHSALLIALISALAVVLALPIISFIIIRKKNGSRDFKPAGNVRKCGLSHSQQEICIQLKDSSRTDKRVDNDTGHATSPVGDDDTHRTISSIEALVQTQGVL